VTFSLSIIQQSTQGEDMCRHHRDQKEMADYISGLQNTGLNRDTSNMAESLGSPHQATRELLWKG
jgi:hypothetical protein